MVRRARYPYSPLQEIFMPEKVPFLQYDIASHPAPQPVLPEYEKRPEILHDECLLLLNRYQDALFQHGHRLCSTVQVSHSFASYSQCMNKMSSLLVRLLDSQYCKLKVAVGTNEIAGNMTNISKLPISKPTTFKEQYNLL